MHYFAVVQPQPLSLQGGGLANRIVGGSPAMHQPLYSSIRRRPAGYGHPLTTTHSRLTTVKTKYLTLCDR